MIKSKSLKRHEELGFFFILKEIDLINSLEMIYLTLNMHN